MDLTEAGFDRLTSGAVRIGGRDVSDQGPAARNVAMVFQAYAVGPLFETALFNGDFKGWTNGEGSGTPFMFLLQLPLVYFVVSWSFYRLFGHVLRNRMLSLNKSSAGKLDALRWVALLFCAMLLSYVVAALLTLIGFDPRGKVVDIY